MTKLERVDADDLRSALADADGAKATKRLMVALAYKDGVNVDVIASRYGIPQSTVYYWLDRFEEQPLARALEDESRPGRPPKLTDEQRAEVAEWLKRPPETDEMEETDSADGWTAERLQRRIAEEFDVEYSIPHVTRTFLK